MKALKELSQQQKILTLMCRNPDKDWWFPYDFMDDKLGDLFVGYEASARLSELAKNYPDMVESEHADKYIKRRLRMDELAKWLHMLPKDLRYVFHRAGLTKGIPKEPKPTPPAAPSKTTNFIGTYVGRTYNREGYQTGEQYELKIERLIVGKPVRVALPFQRIYQNPSEFKKDWKVSI